MKKRDNEHLQTNLTSYRSFVVTAEKFNTQLKIGWSNEFDFVFPSTMKLFRSSNKRPIIDNQFGTQVINDEDRLFFSVYLSNCSSNLFLMTTNVDHKLSCVVLRRRKTIRSILFNPQQPIRGKQWISTFSTLIVLRRQWNLFHVRSEWRKFVFYYVTIIGRVSKRKTRTSLEKQWLLSKTSFLNYSPVWR